MTVVRAIVEGAVAEAHFVWETTPPRITFGRGNICTHKTVATEAGEYIGRVFRSMDL